MRKFGIALLLGFLTGSALAISVGIEQSLTAETRYIESQKAETAIHLTPQEAHDLIQTNRTNPHLIILDVRTPREFSQGHLENAINIDFHAETFRQDINQLDRDIVKSGVRGKFRQPSFRSAARSPFGRALPSLFSPPQFEYHP